LNLIFGFFWISELLFGFKKTKLYVHEKKLLQTNILACHVVGFATGSSPLAPRPEGLR
jgi:hypothetical protein